MVKICGWGSYLPLYRIERTTIADQHRGYGGGGEVAVPAHDATGSVSCVNVLSRER